MSQNQSVIIVAGGKGTRMKSDLPKQFLELCKKPVLMHTLEAFHRYDESIQIVLVLPRDQIEYWESLCGHFQFIIPHTTTHGGVTRFDSVKNGLELIENEGVTAVHDGVRPLVSQDTLLRCFEAAAKSGAVIPVTDVIESVRQIQENGSSLSVDRSLYRLVQTPQVFSTRLLKEAYEQKFNPLFTDDASVVEALGHSIQLVDGNRENIKITTPMDILIAETLI